MANFEALIRGALAAKEASSPEERAVVYQSSRNALQRLIEANRSITVESAVQEQKALEESILRIESEFQPAPVSDVIVETAETAGSNIEVPSGETSLAEAINPAEAEGVTDNAEKAVVHDDPFLEIQQVLGVSPDEVQRSQDIAQSQTMVPEPEPELAQTAEVAVDPIDEIQVPPELEFQVDPSVDGPQTNTDIYVDEPATIPTAFAKRRKSQRNWFWFILFIVILGLLAWVGYRTFLGVMDGSLLGLNNTSQQSNVQNDEQSSYFTIVEPGDLTALVVSDRGRVEIVNEQGLEMIRILSVRNQADRAEAAAPILLRLKPGVIEQIRGKRVTAEIFARSGKSGPAQFSIECQFGSQLGCGRKRFRVGVQPEASIFAFTMEGNRDINSDAFVAISTDITDNAAITGEGDVLDIVYVRLRTSKDN